MIFYIDEDNKNNNNDNDDLEYQTKEEKIKTIFVDEIEDEEEKKTSKKAKIDTYEAKPNLINDDQNINLRPITISSEMRKSFLEYAMSVIIARALPDAKDGLKPVHRRILYAMNELGIFYSTAHKKSARIVGEVLGKYHPHGDSSVYDAMTRMAQDFSMRYPLIDGHGNFGSIDGDEPAAMRYTEARMSKITSILIDTIKKDTVDFRPNYDNSETEPIVLPSRFPNLLVNGATGIAVGMATSIPPHNLNEVINATIAQINNPDINIDQLLEHIKGPDFPTSALILKRQEIIDGYKSGRGFVTIRSQTHFETTKSNRSRIIITQIPYMVNKAKLVEKIADLVKNKIIDGISDLRDESSSSGIRIVIELKKDVYPEVMLNKLFKMTQLQTNFSFNMLALVEGEPKLLNIKQLIEVFINHQEDIITRRSKFDLNKHQAKVRILKGLKIAIENINNVIQIIKTSKNDQEASLNLEKTYNLTNKQSKAIIEMRLGRLTNLAINKMESEIQELVTLINQLENILNNKDELKKLLIDELNLIKEKYGDSRKSSIVTISSDINDEDLIPKTINAITMTNKGYVKRMDLKEFQIQKRGGIGVKAMNTYEDDDVFKIITSSSHSDLLIFTSLAKVYRLKVYQLPELSKQAKGLPFINLISISKNEEVISIIALDNYYEDKYLITITKNGILKKTKLTNYSRINRNGKIALNIREDDKLVTAILANNNDEIIIGSNNGYVNYFSLSKIRPLSRTAMGVKGIKLDLDSKVIGASIVKENAFVFSLGSDGFGKLTPISEYRLTNRGTKGIKSINVAKAGKLIYLGIVKGDEDFLVTTKQGTTIRTSLSQVSHSSRNTKGVKIIKLTNRNKITAVSIIDVLELNKQIDNI